MMKKYIFLISIIVLSIMGHWIYINLDKPIAVANYKKENLMINITKQEALASDCYHVTITTNTNQIRAGINNLEIVSGKNYQKEALEVIAMEKAEGSWRKDDPFFVQRLVVPGKIIKTNATRQIGGRVLEWRYAVALPEKNIKMYVDYEMPQEIRIFLLMGVMVGLGVFLVWIGYYWIKKTFE